LVSGLLLYIRRTGRAGIFFRLSRGAYLTIFFAGIAVALAYPVGWILCSALLLIRYRRSPLVRGPEAARKTRG
jgi:hypothetical protein